MMRIAIFASGSGSNAENFHDFFENHPQIQIAKVYTNSTKAGVIQRCTRLGLPYSVFSKAEMNDGTLLKLLKEDKIDAIVLAGFLLLIPPNLIEAFPDRIINIHPALLPHYGGKGMYGDRVHEAVIENGESRSGITIHLVNEEYDQGRYLAQIACGIGPKDDAQSLASKIHELEYEYFPRIVEGHLEELMANSQ